MRERLHTGRRAALHFDWLRPYAAPVALTASVFALAFGAAGQSQGRGHHGAPRVPCATYAVPDRAGKYLSADDVLPPTRAVDGDDLLALVDRSPRFALSPSYAPRDLLNIHTMLPGSPASCDGSRQQCLRHDAALALRRLVAAMRADGEHPHVDSAYRGYQTQCRVFRQWAYSLGHGFCHATVSSALPGHSQHQLGTAVDLLTRTWVSAGLPFRNGFGCSTGGRWIAAHSWEYGFVLPYPLHPDYRVPGSDCVARVEDSERIDPRTGYKYEPWHIRYVGEENAARFHADWLASGPGTDREITLEQWLRARLGEADAVEPCVCDGCACGACETFHAGSDGPCGGDALSLGADGRPALSAAAPTIVSAVGERDADGAAVVRVVVNVPANTLTQPPVMDPTMAVRFGPRATMNAMSVVPGGVAHAFPSLPGAWRVAVGEEAAGVENPWPFRAALANADRDRAVNGFNARIPASAGRVEVVLPIDGVVVGTRLRVALVRDDEAVQVQSLGVLRGAAGP